MKIKIQRSFLEALLFKADTVSGGKAMTALNSFLIELVDGRIQVVKTDRMLSVIAETRAFELLGSDGPTRFMINSPRLMSLVKNLEDGDVVFTITDSGIEIEAGGYVANWLLEDASKFPPLPQFSVDNMVQLDTKKFVEAVDRVKFAASADSLTAIYKQIYFEAGDCWAIDGYRFQNVKSGLQDSFEMILPVAAMEIIKFLKLGNSEKFLFKTDNNFYVLGIGPDFFICRVPQLSIPSYADFLNKIGYSTEEGRLSFEVPLLMRMAKRIGITSAEGSSRIDFNVIPGHNVEIIGKDEFGNRSKETLTAAVTGKAKKFGLHWMDLVLALSSVKSGSAELLVYKQHLGIRTEDGIGILPMLAI